MDTAALDLKRKAYTERLEAALQSVTSQLASLPEVHKIILFGSYAEGRRDLFTDLDLLVVMETEQDIVTRTAEMYRRLQSGVDMDIIVYTPEEFEALRSRGFVRQATSQGKVLYEKTTT